MDYAGIKNFPSITQREFLLDFFGREKGYMEYMNEWLRDLDSMDNLEKSIVLEEK